MRINQTNTLPTFVESVANPSSKKGPENREIAASQNTYDVFESKAASLKQPSASITGIFRRPDLGDLLESKQEEVKNSRDEYKKQFQDASQKEQEAQEKLIALSKTMNQLRSGNIKI